MKNSTKFVIIKNIHIKILHLKSSFSHFTLHLHKDPPHHHLKNFIFLNETSVDGIQVSKLIWPPLKRFQNFKTTKDWVHQSHEWQGKNSPEHGIRQILLVSEIYKRWGHNRNKMTSKWWGKYFSFLTQCFQSAKLNHWKIFKKSKKNVFEILKKWNYCTYVYFNLK